LFGFSFGNVDSEEFFVYNSGVGSNFLIN